VEMEPEDASIDLLEVGPVMDMLPLHLAGVF
jgi:hypothetical protein